MDCKQFLERLCDYLDGDCGPRSLKACDGHLTECDRCACVVKTVRKTIELYRKCEAPEVPRHLIAQALRKARAACAESRHAPDS